jgi:hypothetical protein
MQVTGRPNWDAAVSGSSGSTTTAHIDLLGSASGSADRALTPAAFAHPFGAVRYWVGFSFYVGDALVTRRGSQPQTL